MTSPSVSALVKTYRSFVSRCKNAGLAHRLGEAGPNEKFYQGARKSDPSARELEPLLPPAYRAFVAAAGYPCFDLGSAHRLCFLPPLAMRQVTGAMGDPARPFDETRTLREKKTYTWPFAVFAGWDFADVNGSCFMPEEPDGPPVVWNVEDSLPESPLGPFEAWLTKALTTAERSISSPAKVKKLLASFEADEDDRRVIRLRDFA